MNPEALVKLKGEIQDLRKSFDWSDSIYRMTTGGYAAKNGPTRNLDQLCVLVISLIEKLEQQCKVSDELVEKVDWLWRQR